MAMQIIRVLIADDQVLTRQGLTSLSETNPQIEIVGEAEDGLVTLNMVEQLRPDIVLMDLRMPKLDGIEATKIINSKFPEVKVLILTTFDDEEYIKKTLETKASGYLLKESSFEDIVNAIILVSKGFSLFSPNILDNLQKKIIVTENLSDSAKQLQKEIEAFSSQERKILYLILCSMTNKEIGKALFLGEHTIRNYITGIFKKLNVENRAQAFRASEKYQSILKASFDVDLLR
jgi:DNA-binding NarL/FixJ family response regulator